MSGRIENNFWDYVRKTNDCWEWTASKARGYGQFSYKGQKTRKKAHRHSYELAFGKIPKGMDICHRCDNPGCVNPDHLFLGTAKDNMQDAKNKKRTTFGEKNTKAKLTEVQVIEIRKLCDEGFLQKEVAVIFGVLPSSINKIVKGHRWGHLNA